MSRSDVASTAETADEPQARARALDLRLVPAAVAVWTTTAWGLTAPSSHIVVGVCGAVAVSVAMVWAVRGHRGRWLVHVAAVAVAVVAALTATGVRMAGVQRSPVADLARERAVAAATVELTSDVVLFPRKGVRPELARTKGVVVVLEARGRHVRGRVPIEVTATGDLARGLSDQPAGTRLQVSGRLAEPDPGQAIAATLRVTGPVVVARAPTAGHVAINRVRDALVRAMNHSPPDQAGLVPSLVVGDTSGLPAEVVEQFKATGLTHLTAVSGETTTKKGGSPYAESRSMRNLGEGVNHVRRGELARIDAIARAATPHSHELRKERGDG